MSSDPDTVPAAVAASCIRPLHRGDRSPLLEIVRATGVFSEEECAIALELIDAVLDRPGQKDYDIAVCEQGGVVQGYYCIGPTPATLATYDLYWIAVDPRIHGRGVGARLTAHAEETIRARGGSLIMVETSSRSAYDGTRAFYVRMGYDELARIRSYYRPGDDLVVYGKYLS
jgi:ribosomal protein S18 acetylase RimI-like enzyme